MESSGARCCMRSGCFDCNKTSRYIKTVPLITPYYRDIISNENLIDGNPAPENNYFPYELFTFRSKFERKLYAFDPTYHFSFVKKELNNVMRLTIEIFKGITFVPLNEKNASILQEYINQSVSTYPEHVLLFDSRVQIERGNKILSKSWIASLLPFISFEKRFKAIIEDGKIYISLKGDLEYAERYSKMLNQLTHLFFDYFNRGVVPLSLRFHNNIINDFKMALVHEQRVSPGGEDLAGEIKLFEPTWSNPNFAPDLVSFIYDRIQGKKELSIEVGDNFVRRHYVAVALTKLSKSRFKTYPSLQEYIPTFFGKNVLVPTTDLRVSFEITNTILNAQSKSEGKVQVVPLESKEKYEKTVENIKVTYKMLIPNEDIILYKAIDNPEYVASFILPTNDSLVILKK